MNVVAALTMTVLLTGCAHEGVKKAVVSYGQAANDQLLDDAIFFKCQGATIGAIVRRYGDNIEVWNAECLPKGLGSE